MTRSRAAPQRGIDAVVRAIARVIALASLHTAAPTAMPAAAAADAPSQARLSLGSRTAWGAEQLMANVLRNPDLSGVWNGALIIVAQVDGAHVGDHSCSTTRSSVRPLELAVEQAARRGMSVDVTEVNFHTTGGTDSGAERDAVLTAPGVGAALMRHLLQAAAAGVRRQVVYQLAGYDGFFAGQSRQLAQLFGITRDVASAANWRPTGAAMLALNER